MASTASSGIFRSFPISDSEYRGLEAKFGDLCNFAAWQLVRKNLHNNTTDDPEDIIQELKMSLLHAGSYYKRQIYIESCFAIAKQHCHDGFLRGLLGELETLWFDRRRHGARRQKFGEHQEKLLDRIVLASVPADVRPRKDRPLDIDRQFATYCKSVTWNQQRSMGRKITRERAIRHGLVSLSEFDYLGGCGSRSTSEEFAA